MFLLRVLPLKKKKKGSKATVKTIIWENKEKWSVYQPSRIALSFLKEVWSSGYFGNVCPHYKQTSQIGM